MYAKTSPLLFLITLGMIAGCNTQSGDNNIVSGNSNAPTLSMTAQFDQVTTGWKDASGTDIAIQVTSSASGANLLCRYAHTSVISSATYSACNVVNGKVSLSQPVTGITNGTFEFQVKANGDAVYTTGSVKFYVHDSLNSAAKCTGAKTDAQYLSIAASYLDQSLAFGPSTSTSNPFVKIAFPTVPVGSYLFTNGSSTDNYATTSAASSYDLRSLRKRFIPNSAKSLMLLRREYESRFRPGTCDFEISSMGYDINGNWPDLAAGGVPPHPGDSATSRNWMGYEVRCDAVVFNSLKKGVCFRGAQIFFISRLGRAFKTQFMNFGGKYTRTQRMTSSKFTLAEKAEYDATIARAISDGDTNPKAHYIYLDD